RQSPRARCIARRQEPGRHRRAAASATRRLHVPVLGSQTWRSCSCVVRCLQGVCSQVPMDNTKRLHVQPDETTKRVQIITETERQNEETLKIRACFERAGSSLFSRVSRSALPCLK